MRRIDADDPTCDGGEAGYDTPVPAAEVQDAVGRADRGGEVGDFGVEVLLDARWGEFVARLESRLPPRLST